MHDMVSQNLYDAIVKLCLDNAISKIYNLQVTAHTDSHIDEESIRQLFRDKNNALIGSYSNIIVQYREMEQHTAAIDYIDGVKQIKHA